MIDVLTLSISLGYNAERFALLCKVVLGGPTCFVTDGNYACLSVDNEPWMMVGREIPQGILYEFVD